MDVPGQLYILHLQRPVVLVSGKGTENVIVHCVHLGTARCMQEASGIFWDFRGGSGDVEALLTPLRLQLRGSADGHAVETTCCVSAVESFKPGVVRSSRVSEFKQWFVGLTSARAVLCHVVQDRFGICKFPSPGRCKRRHGSADVHCLTSQIDVKSSPVS